MPINYWIYIDLLLLLIQLGFVLRYYSDFKNSLGKINAIGLSVGTALFIFPMGLIPVGISDLALRDEIFRDFLWHMKVLGGFSAFDIILLTYFISLLFVSYKTILIKKYFGYFFIMIIIIFLGVVSVLNAPFGVDYKLLLNAFRSFLLMLIALVLSFRLKSKGIGWLKDYLFLLIVISYLSILSMLLLEPEIRSVRYWTHAILQSQGVPLIASITWILFLFTHIFNSFNIFKKLLIVSLPFIVSILGGVKGMMLIILIILSVLLFTRIKDFNVGLLFFLKNKTFILLFTLLLPLMILVVNLNFLGIDSINTRYFQVFNSMSTLWNNGISSLMFGIGWKQWYIEYVSSPIVDYGAWTPEEVSSTACKNSIQLLPFSFVRSVGLVGLVLFSLFFYKVVKHYSFVGRQKIGMNFLLLFILIGEIIAIPDVLPESAFLSILILFVLIDVKGQRKNFVY